MEEVKTIDSRSCKEIYVIFNKLGLFNKLPNELKQYISKNQSLSYEYDFNIDLPLIYQIDNEKTKEYISYLYLKFINDRDNERNMLLTKYEENEILHQKELKEKYNPDNLFKNKSNMNVEDKADIVEMVKYKKSFWRKIFDKIKGIFDKE